MDNEIKGVAEHILDLGCGALAHALRHAMYAPMLNSRWPDLSVLQAAHAAELFVKARIAEEHPLLIFEQLPKPSEQNPSLSIKTLFEGGRTYQWAELPARLWATTGLRLRDEKAWSDFGKLRNTIQHFASPNRNLQRAALEFVFGVVDPFINECWNLYAIDFNEDFDHYEHVFESLLEGKYRSLVSPDSVEHVEPLLEQLEITAEVRAYFDDQIKARKAERLVG